MDTISTEVASMEESYGEEAYEDYGGYDGQEYEGQGYGGNGDGGQKDLNSFVLKTGSGFTCTECGKEFNDKSNCRRHLVNIVIKHTRPIMLLKIIKENYMERSTMQLSMFKLEHLIYYKDWFFKCA
eukprot:TRINITY_DN31652_c0_g1_i1.p1 TRINITY_DN31652_c0_g1~~TRINITY_DN31652_c0_g1_i1.p1  ORF type:complete len:126 (-),score=31.65 TRINITY_DN31652_c0_g1_i1:47-424(-)